MALTIENIQAKLSDIQAKVAENDKMIRDMTINTRNLKERIQELGVRDHVKDQSDNYPDEDAVYEYIEYQGVAYLRKGSVVFNMEYEDIGTWRRTNQGPTQSTKVYGIDFTNDSLKR